MSKTIEIILCTMCKGEGVQRHDEMTSYHKREYTTHVTECKWCNGSGRRLKTTEIKYEPYINPKLGSF